MSNYPFSTPHTSTKIFLAQGTSLALCIVIAVTTFTLSALGKSFFDWSDAIYYLATAKYMMLQCSFAPLPTDFAFLTKILQQPHYLPLNNYPNYGFEMLLGILSVALKNFSLFNGILLSGLITLLTALTLYGCAIRQLRDKGLAVLVVAGVLFHRVVFEISPRPLSDSGLLLSWVLAVWAMLQNRTLLAGLALGLGYFYREHALLFLPFLPLLSPRCNSIKNYIKIVLPLAVAFAVGPFAAVICKNIYMQGGGADNLYAAHYKNAFRITTASLTRLISHCKTYIINLGIVLLAVAFYILLRIRVMDNIVVRLFVVSLIIGGLPCILFIPNPTIPERYLAYVIPLLWLATAIMLKKAKYRYIYMAGMVALMLILRWPPAINSASLKQLPQLDTAFSRLHEQVDAPFRLLAKEFSAKGAVLLSNAPPFALVSLDSPLEIRLPDYETFLNGPNNYILHGIVLISSQSDWPDLPRIVDKAGVTFERIGTPGELVPYLSIYKRVAL